ncbi:hypothetical protein BE20_13645 [Sorangium cellulosum]|nr:hypothetical protein BE20_13645 [Sorangium cellulosum]
MGPQIFPCLETPRWACSTNRRSVTLPEASGLPRRTTPTKRSLASACTRISGPISPMMPTSRSIRPSRSAATSSSPSGRKRTVTPGASALRASSSGAPRSPSMPSLVRTAKLRVSAATSTAPRSRRTALAEATTARTRGRSSAARGVGTSRLPARTRIGSPTASRTRASVRLMAEGLRCIRRAATRTLSSSRSTSSATSRFRSMECMGRNDTLPTMHWKPCPSGRTFRVEQGSREGSSAVAVSPGGESPS